MRKGKIPKSSSFSIRMSHEGFSYSGNPKYMAVDLEKANQIFKDQQNSVTGNKIVEGFAFALFNLLMTGLGTYLGVWGFAKKSQISTQAYRSRKEMAKELNNEESQTASTTTTDYGDMLTSEATFLEWFMRTHPMPELPPFLKKIMDGTPRGYEVAMLLHLLSMLGAMCFSKDRAKYLDGKTHAPNIQVVIEGGFGQGKGKFSDMFRNIFKRFIERDAENLSDEESQHILQTATIGISHSRLIDILSQNQGVHFYLYSPEMATVVKDQKKGNGIAAEVYRVAFDNDPIGRLNKTKDCQGSFPVFLNYTITGTPGEVKIFIDNQLEGGTASRIGWCVIPQCGREIPVQKYPSDAELEKMRDQLDAWARESCFTTDENGDHAVLEKVHNLDYVCEALKKWNEEQYDRYEADGNATRKDLRMRMATIAFHCAIVLHRLFGEPSSKRPTDRKKVVDLTLFIATYCMERFIHKFSKQQNEQRTFSNAAENVTAYSTGEPATTGTVAPKKTAAEWAPEWHRINTLPKDDPDWMGYGRIATKFGFKKDEVVNALRKYRSQIDWVPEKSGVDCSQSSGKPT